MLWVPMVIATCTVMCECECQLKTVFHKKRVIHLADPDIAVAKDRQQVCGYGWWGNGRVSANFNQATSSEWWGTWHGA